MDKTLLLLGEKPPGFSQSRFSSDGKTIASGGSDNTIKLWDVETKQNIATLTGHEDIIFSVAFSPDGRILASGSQDDTVKLWHVETGQNLHTFKHSAARFLSGVFHRMARSLLVEHGEELNSGTLRQAKRSSLKTEQQLGLDL